MSLKIVTFYLLLLPLQICAQKPITAKAAYTKSTKASAAKNWKDALKWYTISAQKGNADAMYNLGYMYESGEGIDQNYPEAMKWYRKAIAKGQTNAMVALGIIYQNHDSYTEAENCFKLAADKGNTDAEDLLGYFYFIKERYKEALVWLNKAAIKNKPMSLYYLAEMYYNGYEVQQDQKKAKLYFEKAAEMGEENAISKLKTIQ